MSNFICEKCGMTNIDCGHQGYKTEREIELEKQLDREIHINRKMKMALEKYADLKNWRCDTITGFQSVWQGGVDDEQTGNITALQILKEIDNKE